MKRLTCAVVLACVIIVPRTTASVRLRFTGEYRGQQASGLTVCFYPGKFTTSIIDQNFASGDVRCLSAESILEIPPGYWAMYGTVDGKLISAMTTGIMATEGDAYEKPTLVLVEGVSARLPVLQPGARLVLYFPRTSEHAALTLPVLAAAAETLIPLARPFVAITVRDGRLEAVSGLQSITTPGEEVQHPRLLHDRFDLVVTPAIDLHSARSILAAGVESRPHVVLRVDGREVTPDVALADVHAPDLVLFNDVPRIAGASYELIVGGNRWTRTEVPFEPPRGPILVFDGTPATAPESQISVRPIPSSIFEWRRACADGAPQPPLDVVLSDCTRGTPPAASILHVDRTQCMAVARRRVTVDEPALTLDGLVPGTYLLSVASAADVVSETLVTLGLAMSVEVDPFEDRRRLLTGRVQDEDGSPVSAELRLSSIRAATAPETGEYAVPLSAAVSERTRIVVVRRCDAPHRETLVILDESAGSFGRWDITVPSHAVRLTVRDSSTDKPVAGATTAVVLRVPRTEDGRARVAEDRHPGPTTDERGEVEVPSVQASLAYDVCASHPDFETQCLAFTKTPDVKNELRLRPRQVRKGRILAAGRIEAGRLAWVRDGFVTEATSVAPNGEFRSAITHAAGERLVFVSRSHPLFVLPLPADDGSVTLPAVGAMNFKVRDLGATRNRDALLALQVDGTLIPRDLFAFHQAMRGSQSVLVHGGPLPVTDIGAVGPIVVIKGPPPDAPALSALAGRDLFALPEYRTSLSAIRVLTSEVVFQ